MRAISTLTAAIAAASYPLAVYYGLTSGGARWGVWLLLAAWLVSGVASWSSSRAAPTPSAVAVRGRSLGGVTSLGLGLVLGASLLLDEQRYLFAVPVLINLSLFWAFASSLLAPQPLVERFARLQVADLSAEEVEYCRRVTISWCAFFVFNGGTSALLAWAAPLSWWTLYTGLIAYVLIGVVATTEFTLRKYRFRRYGQGWLDRCYRVVFPPRSVGS